MARITIKPVTGVLSVVERVRDALEDLSYSEQQVALDLLFSVEEPPAPPAPAPYYVPAGAGIIPAIKAIRAAFGLGLRQAKTLRDQSGLVLTSEQAEAFIRVCDDYRLGKFPSND